MSVVINNALSGNLLDVPLDQLGKLSNYGIVPNRGSASIDGSSSSSSSVLSNINAYLLAISADSYLISPLMSNEWADAEGIVPAVVNGLVGSIDSTF